MLAIEAILALVKEAIFTTVLVSMPVLIVSLLVGLIVALFSATTQIQEQTLSFAPKMIAVYVSIVIFGALMGGKLISFAEKCFLLIKV